MKYLFVNKSILVNKKVEKLNNHLKSSSRFDDYFQTPEEIIFKNFNDEEIKLLRADPNYFKLDSNDMNELLLINSGKLVDTLNEEEKGTNLEKIRYRVMKIAKSPIKR